MTLSLKMLKCVQKLAKILENSCEKLARNMINMDNVIKFKMIKRKKINNDINSKTI